MNIVKFHLLANKLIKIKLGLLARFIYALQFLIFNSYLPPSVKIGSNTKFAYGGIGVVVHKDAVIGANCIIGQGVTIGGRSKIKEVPVILDNVYIGAGARIIGNVVIGENSVIGANAVVITDIPANCVAVGIPAKVIKRNINPKDFY